MGCLERRVIWIHSGVIGTSESKYSWEHMASAEFILFYLLYGCFETRFLCSAEFNPSTVSSYHQEDYHLMFLVALTSRIFLKQKWMRNGDLTIVFFSLAPRCIKWQTTFSFPSSFPFSSSFSFIFAPLWVTMSPLVDFNSTKERFGYSVEDWLKTTHKNHDRSWCSSYVKGNILLSTANLPWSTDSFSGEKFPLLLRNGCALPCGAAWFPHCQFRGLWKC